MTHTSTPWTVTANSWQYTTIYSADGTRICQLDLEDWDVTEDSQTALEAKQAKVAALLSAAPDLLAALKATLEIHVDMANSGDCGFWDPEDEEHVKQARAAISKAEAS